MEIFQSLIEGGQASFSGGRVFVDEDGVVSSDHRQFRVVGREGLGVTDHLGFRYACTLQGGQAGVLGNGG